MALAKYIQILYKVAHFTIYSIFRGYLWPNIRRLKRKDDICYILGNGSSFSKDKFKYAKFLQNSSFFVVNSFALADEYAELKPEFYVFADPGFWDKNVRREDYEYGQAVLKILEERTTWLINIIVPYAAAEIFKKRFYDNNYIKIFYFNNSILDTGTNFDFFVFDKFGGAPVIQNVIVSAIFNAISIGFKEINLIGVEHSWTEDIKVDIENRVCLIDKHFYEDNSAVSLLPWFRLDGRVYKMHEILSDLSKIFYGYHRMKDFGSYKNAKIYNLTNNSFIDAFEKK